VKSTHDELKIKARLAAAAIAVPPRQAGQSGGRAPRSDEWACACCERRVQLAKGEQFPACACHPTEPATWTNVG
jgi:hypothetical protein